MRAPLPVLAGGLVVAWTRDEARWVAGGSGSGIAFLDEARRAFHGLGTHVPLYEIPLPLQNATVAGLLPLLAQTSIAHAGVRHTVVDGVAWARTVRGSAWTVPCLVVSSVLDEAKCTAGTSLPAFSQKLEVWCAATHFIAREAGKSGEGTYTEQRPARLPASSVAARAGVSPRARECLNRFNPL